MGPPCTPSSPTVNRASSSSVRISCPSSLMSPSAPAVRPACRPPRQYCCVLRTEFRVCDPARPPAAELIAAVLAEYDERAGRPLRGGPSAGPDDFSPPGGAYVVGFVLERPACGA